ncbi:MAG: cytochrome c oxidase assembly protein, partial [Ilumatobacteraceae bacterium]
MSLLAVDPWRFQQHVEVWLLVGFLTAAYVYMVKVLGPRAVGPGGVVVTRGQKSAFVLGILILWFASDWPMHDIAEEYLYSVHMFQHMALTYFMPPLVVLATPEWFVRVLIGDGRLYRFVRFMAHPVLSALLFNVAIMVSHVPGVVNASVSNGPLHYGVHVFLVTTAILMWLPVCGPFPEFQISPMGKMIYFFMNSVVATVPAGWLTFAEGVVYKHYSIPWRVWGVSVTDDQQIAGAIMKVGGAIFLWSIIGVLFVQKFVKTFRAENDSAYVREPLTMADVEKAFAESPPAR